jgi:hypothetical protein
VHPFFKREGKVFEHTGVTPIDGGLLDFEDKTFLDGR